MVAKTDNHQKIYLFTKEGSVWKRMIIHDSLKKPTNDRSKAPSILSINGVLTIIYSDDTKVYKTEKI